MAKATINPNVQQQIVRAIARCQRIKLWQEQKPKASKERKASMQKELDDKMEFLKTVKADIEALESD